MLEQFIDQLAERMKLRIHANRASREAVVECLFHFVELKDIPEIIKVMEWIDAGSGQTRRKVNRTGRRIAKNKKGTNRKVELPIRALNSNSKSSQV